METLAAETLPTSIMAEFTTSLVPAVTRVDSRPETSPVAVILAVSVVFILSPLTVSGNSVILAAFYRYKRLRTASNCLLASLAVSDLGVGVFMPFGMHLELSGIPDDGVSSLCIAPYCIVITLCSVSVLVTVAIAVDRLTSLAQPLRYKNIITHSSIEKYIAVFWLYAIVVGLSPLIYAEVTGSTQSHSGSCRFSAAVSPPVRIFLVVAVWAPSALVLLGCYMYVYLVARSHARAIYTVELSFRHQTQTLALPRYGQTLALTVGAFLVLWLPFQTCMLVDIFCGTKILSEWAVIWLGLPILAHSAANPWIYAFHHGEMRVAAGKIAEDLVALVGVTPSRYGCSPTRRGSNMNLELAEVINSNDGHRPRPEDCFAAKHHSVCASRKCLEMSSKMADISPERDAVIGNSSLESREEDIVEENIHDLTKMLDPKYIVDRNHVIDSNHNIDKIKNLKYLLDPTFNKIRHLRRLNHKKMSGKNFPRFHDPKFISYQNLKSDGTLNPKLLQLNTMSDPVLNAESPAVETKDFSEAICTPSLCTQRRNSNLASMSDPNLKAAAAGNAADVNLRVFPASRVAPENHRYSVQSLDHKCDHGQLHSRHVMQCRQLIENQRRQNGYVKPQLTLHRHADSVSPIRDLRFQNCVPVHTDDGISPRPCGARFCHQHQVLSPRKMTITTNRLANFYHPDSSPDPFRRLGPSTDPTMRLLQARQKLEILKHSESINTIEPMSHVRLLEPSRVLNTLTVPTIHSEPPSPIDPIPLDPLKEEETLRGLDSTRFPVAEPLRPEPPVRRKVKSPARHSDPIVPPVLLNFEDCSDIHPTNGISTNGWDSDRGGLFDGESLTDVPVDLGKSKLSEPVFSEHNSTRHNSRRPSDSRWSESSRSQEILSNITEHRMFPSSYSVNNFQNCNSGSDLNDVDSIDPFMCPEALSSSLQESFFSAEPSVPGSDVFASFDETDEIGFTTDLQAEREVPGTQEAPICFTSSMSTTNLKKVETSEIETQSRSTESVFRANIVPDTCAVLRIEPSILRLEPSIHRSRPHIRPGKGYILKDPSRRTLRLAPLAIPTPTDISTPTFDSVSEFNGENGLGVGV
ncbi:uncharacterized protein LOC124297672 isoform X1 [Neodiprion virginianus]|uniref:uncharacterized protein LOC124297672 isoform X1 n=1 Tax=Neodiprion virginianus TaxID=2961670 RepID=UPI001EE6E4C2|nr:uncharacterized protein LOC124297672 isoform X1 [Neodiprion virginianus]